MEAANLLVFADEIYYGFFVVITDVVVVVFGCRCQYIKRNCELRKVPGA